MKALIGASAVLIAALNSPSEASERAGPDELPSSSPAGIRVAQTGIVELPAIRVSGVPGTSIALSLKSPITGVRFIKISDFPEHLQLSRGFRLKGAWIISVQDLESLELITPPDAAKTIKFDVLYFRNNQTAAVARRVMIVELAPPAAATVGSLPRQDSPAAAIVVPAGPPPATQRQGPPAKKALSDEQEINSLERGAILMRNGDVAAARLLYEDLAVNGSAKGARALAETYDPVYLKGVFTAGLRPSKEKARIWYERAAELGDIVSITRLSVLDQR